MKVKDRGKFVGDLVKGDWLPCKYGWLRVSKAKYLYDRGTTPQKEWRYVKQGLLDCSHVYNLGKNKWTKAILVYGPKLILIV